MIFSVITAQSAKEIDCDFAQPPCVQGYELRLDYLQKLEKEELRKLRKRIKKPLIFTLRRKDQGGAFLGSEKTREQLICQLASLEPDYFDLESDTADTLISYVKRFCPVIGSYHNFEDAPDLDDIYEKMQGKGFSYLKIAVQANSTLDAMTMLDFLRRKSQSNIIGISMGRLGQSTRILGKVFGSPWTYAYHNHPIQDLGQLSLTELTEIYRYDQIDKDTEIYALLGDPVDQSMGHIWHNNTFREEKRNAVYLKLQLQEKQLASFFPLVKKLRFRGFSVTMPLKKAVANYFQSSMKMCNTLYREKDGYVLAQTDGEATIRLLEKHMRLADKKVLVLGAGGSALSVIAALQKRKAIIYSWSRKKVVLTHTTYCSKEEIATIGFDVLVQATSVGMAPYETESILQKEEIPRGILAVDLVYSPEKTTFLQYVVEKGGVAIYGKQVFEEQAALQQELWFKRKEQLLEVGR